jgi:SAM-dependent methyltransferase
MRPVLEPEPLTPAGFIFGESARASSRNVHERLRALEMLCPFPQGVAVDLGCGQGAYTMELLKHFDRVLGVDILPTNVAYARQHLSGNVEFCCAALENTPLAAESVDAAFVIEVLDHVGDVERCLAEMRRILKPRAVAYISVPNAWFPFETHPISLFGKLFHPFLFPCVNWTPFHDRVATARIFQRTMLISLCESLGFHLLASDYVVVPLERRFKFLRPVLAGLAKTPLRPLTGVSLVLALEKNGNVPF